MARAMGVIHEYYSWLEAGQMLWHIHPKGFAGDAFNPNSKGRFAAFAAKPVRAMYYAATTPESAIWEVVLRDLVPAGPIVSVDQALYDDFVLAHVRLKRPISLLDLRAPNLRRLSDDRSRWTEWQRLTVVPELEYPATYSAAVELLKAAGLAAGIQWPSRQCVRDTACVLFAPPLTSADLEVLKRIALGSAEGLGLIDQALALAHLKRADVGALVGAASRDLAASRHS